MAILRTHGIGLNYVETGEGDQCIVFSHGLLMNHRMFDAQVAALSDRYRCIAYDHRGQGASEVPEGAHISIEDCTADALSLIRALGTTPCHFVGLSMGGFVGLRLAARHPELLRSLTLIASAADAEPRANIPKYRRLNFVARWFGVGRPLANKVMPILFGSTFLGDNSRSADIDAWRNHVMANRKTIYKAVNGVLYRDPVPEGALRGITTPTQVIRGTEDVAIARERSLRVCEVVPGARFVEVEGAGHSASVEEPGAVTAAIEEFITSC